MSRISSGIFLCLSLGVAPVAQAGLFDAIKSVVPDVVATQVTEAATSKATEEKPQGAAEKQDAKNPVAAAPAKLELDIEEAARLKELKRVAIAGFALYVITEDSGGITSGSAGHGSMASVHSSVKVVGLDGKRLQALADQALDETRRALEARGIQVMKQSELEALPAYAGLKAAADAAPLALDAKGGKGTVYSARGLPLIHMSEMAWLSRTVGGLFGAKVEDPYVALGDKMSAGFRMGKLKPAMDAMGEAAGVPLVWGRIVLSAAQIKTSGGAFSSSASSEVRNSLVLPPWTNRLLVRLPNGDSGRVSLKNSLMSETSPGELVDVTSTATKTANVLTTAFTIAAAASGHGRAVIGSSQDAELRSSPKQFEAAASPSIQAAISNLASALTP